MTSETKRTPRQRKLRLTVLFLSWSGGLAVVVAVAIHYGRRPAQYDPEEENQAITSSLKLNLPPGAPEPDLIDVTDAAGLTGFRTFAGDRTSQLPEDMGGGAAFGDFDNDGDDDLFLVSAGGNLDLPDNELSPSRLYRNRGDGTFEQVNEFPSLNIRGMGAAWGDFDGDGFIDLVVTGYQTLRLFRNDGGSGRFTRASLPIDGKSFWSGATWGDFDNDRDLDLYVCGYLKYHADGNDRKKISDQIDTAVPFTLNPASFEPTVNLLFRNDGDGRFTEVAEQLGVGNPAGRSLGAVWCDFDEDGWLDLYVANDVSDNAFFHNEQGTFRNISHAAWVADYRSAMGLAVGDWNNDGDDDLFVTHWVAQENALYDNTYADFFKNRNASSRTGNDGHDKDQAKEMMDVPEKPRARFVDVADMRGLGQMSLPFVGWGTEFVDLDQDGWMDLVVANGSTLEVAGPAPRKLQAQESFLLWNNAGQAFHNLATTQSSLSTQHVSRGLASSDIDGDGDLDIVIVDLDGGVRLLRNEMARGNWAQFRLRGRNAVGQLTSRGENAVVTVHVGGRQIRRTINSVSYLSQSSATLHLGLGPAAMIDRVAVRWGGGEVQEFTNLAARTVWELREGESVARRIVHDTSVPHTSRPIVSGDDGERAKIVAFWYHQRAGMQAFRQERNYVRAAGEFELALALNPVHEDALYYYANSLIELDRISDAIPHLQKLTTVNSQSLRGFQQWGTLLALNATSLDDLRESEELLLKARTINPEETGVLQVLGEVALLRGELDLADERLAQVVASNSRAARAVYLRACIAWKNGHIYTSRSLLRQAREALGPEWQPAGVTNEGDVKQRMHVHTTPLSVAVSRWDGDLSPSTAFVTVEAALAKYDLP